MDYKNYLSNIDTKTYLSLLRDLRIYLYKNPQYKNSDKFDIMNISYNNNNNNNNNNNSNFIILVKFINAYNITMSEEQFLLFLRYIKIKSLYKSKL